VSDNFKQLIAEIDELNSKDPNNFELGYSKQLTEWVLRLNPKASLALQIAARGQHVERWTIPRKSYPLNRGGYLRWREELKQFHARTIRQLMKESGYEEEMISQVGEIILKRDRVQNPDSQTIEDALCLVFLETQFEELKAKTPEEKMIGIIQKTWKKMSSQAKSVALTLEMNEEAKKLIQKAIS